MQAASTEGVYVIDHCQSLVFSCLGVGSVEAMFFGDVLAHMFASLCETPNQRILQRHCLQYLLQAHQAAVVSTWQRGRPAMCPQVLETHGAHRKICPQLLVARRGQVIACRVIIAIHTWSRQSWDEKRSEMHLSAAPSMCLKS